MKIKWHGEEYLLIGDLEDGGAIATKEQFENFLPSTAHLFSDGRILQYGIPIGHRSEIIGVGDEND